MADPEFRPEGPREEDRLQLLGSLLAMTELEVAAATRPAEAGEDTLDVVLGWNEQLGPDAELAATVLVNRLERTAMQVSVSDEVTPPPGREAAFAATIAASTHSPPSCTPSAATQPAPDRPWQGRARPSPTPCTTCTLYAPPSTTQTATTASSPPAARALCA
ncbi:hypothetical protein AB4225_29355 [Streptomyces sp. 2RAF24]|uniref:hypothetical protein n=1 Tax=Streptomyces sp. 2RAF24 TaxID=3232997 RepID=UPI003F945A9D